MPVVTVYGVLPSPFCRPVLMTAKAVGVDVEMKTTSPLTGDTHKPEYLEMNPRHNIPTMDDDGYILTESRAIMCYLVDKFGEDDDPLFPKDPQLRNRILERMLFDVGCLSQRCYDYYNREWIFGDGDLDESKLAPLTEAMGFLDKYLEDSSWVAGDNMTLADIGLCVTLIQLEVFGMDFEPYANVTRWYEACKTDVPGFDEINEEGVKIFKAIINK
ncbi:glutathione S-transferase 1-like [Thrips palmi]|uniref:Glutathione S-transferase 1-like n=1 Tax=Thrips palmi TaxID=161013 RepID=A0A6P8ZZ07_THRPL|nr:glutathione S-transferase 1-like [Thrips palmi]